MARELSKEEKKKFVRNRNDILDELKEIQADFEDFSDAELIEHRFVITERLQRLLSLCLETDEDNIE